MRLGLVLLAASACHAGVTRLPTPAGPATELQNGRWFDGTDFRTETVYIAGGHLTRVRPGHVTRVVDLGGGWVIPPLAEAHTHTLVNRDARITEFLDAGIFYAQVMNALRTQLPEARRKFNKPDSVDVVFAVAGLTASDGHPLQIGLRWADSLAALDGDWLHLIDSPADLARKWPSVLASGTDLVKIFLETSEEYAERHGNPAVPMRWRGLDPTIVPDIVGRAHAAGLPVAVHVHTAADFHVAVAAGVDQIAHLPGMAIGPSSPEELADTRLMAELERAERFRIAPVDAQAAARGGIAVQTTIGGDAEPLGADVPDDARRVIGRARAVRREVQIANLRLLRDAGVRLLLASDGGERNARDELEYLATLGVWDAPALLRMATQVTPRAIFPRRKIGRLADGDEASFLVLGANPLEDLGALRKIQRRVKDGVALPETGR